MIQFSGNLSKNFSQAEYHPGSMTVYMYRQTVTFIKCIQAFRTWINKPMYVISWYRTKQENITIGSTVGERSNHRTGTAMDWHLYNHDIDRDEFIRYAKKWAAICKQFGCVGEAGLYGWGVHLGMQNPDQAKSTGHKFVHWDSRSGKQINNPFPELIGV